MHQQSKHLLRILDSTGHTELEYDPADAAAVDDVQQKFDRLMERNFIAFDVTESPGAIMTKFDPAAKEIIISHRFAGG
jgi:hypothetical protein